MDVSKPARDWQAKIKGILLWTMHDYPGLGEISSIVIYLLPFINFHMYILPYVDFVLITLTLLVVFYLVGLSTSGHNACPICGPSLVMERPTLLGKVIYPNNHCFLPCSHSKYVPPSNGMEPFQWNMADWAKR